MQKILLLILITSVLLFSGCSSDNSQIQKSDIEQLVNDALSGDHDANLKLHGFITEKHIGNKDFNQLFVDELKTDNKTYFSVILEYEDPRLNLFAIYDNQLNVYIFDKSLNGYLNSKWFVNKDEKYVFLQERFFTKDVLSIDRLSIYKIGENLAWLVYREPSRFVKDNNLAYQRIESLNDKQIITKITGTDENPFNIKVDTFYFNSTTKKYSSNQNIFENFVDWEINNFMWTIIKPQITADFVDAESDTATKDYKISLDKNWQKISKYIEDKRLKQQLRGVRYENIKDKSSFTVLQIPKGEDGEKYCPYILTETMSGKYRIRASEVFEIGNNYLQIFEHTCGSTKYFLLFECSRSIYLENRKIFSSIINSFSIDC